MPVEYSNPRIPEGINTTGEHPLKEFAILLSGIVAVIVVVTAILGLSADRLAQWIPFSFEQSMVSGYEQDVGEDNDVQRELQALADRLAARMDLPADMNITVHYIDDDMVNASASLAGHVMMYRGLLERLDSENAVAMLLAHEIAHIRHRHPIRAMGRGVVVGLALMAVTGAGGNQAAARLLGDAGLLTLLSFNRGQEAEADRTGLAAVAELYGHSHGALDLYRILLDEADSGPFQAPVFLSTHPLTAERINQLTDLAAEKGWPDTGPKTAPGEAVEALRTRVQDEAD